MKSCNKGPMRVQIGGSRGSLPVAGSQYQKAGGNTTCLRVFSECLPPDMALIIDGGTGFLPVSQGARNDGATHLMILETHHHHDHNQGFFIAPATFIPNIKKTVWGPIENGFGPREVFTSLMRPPFHPVPAELVLSSFSFKSLPVPSAYVILFHPNGGPLLVAIDKYQQALSGTGMIKFGPQNIQKIAECLLVRMLYSTHPERTISYRFEELTTGKVFTFLTDHENTADLPLPMQRHLENSGLVIMDSQYDSGKYATTTKGYGHGTPRYCVDTAIRVGAKQLGLTHHDPTSTDDYLERVILKEAVEEMARRSVLPEAGLITLKDIFLCSDGMVIDV